jgi:hypothetical protein
MGFLSADQKKNSVTTTTQNWVDSFNTNTTRTEVTEGSGNTTLTINDTSGGIPSWLAPVVVIVVVLLIGAGVILPAIKSKGS